ncbi:MAG TPA: aspartate aminotransferase family protein, partial [Candidatus Omnitrophota bacterium]|nr:aspartate aminotransferase family protein [Candidatus Omnitrophota bacterium]
EKGKAFLKRLKSLQKKHPKLIGDVDGMGMALRMEMTKNDGYTPDRELADRMFNLGLKGGIPTSKGKMGLVLDVGGYYKNVFTIAPSFFITEPEMDLAIELFDALIRKAS